jgi:hypothetical protein
VKFLGGQMYHVQYCTLGLVFCLSDIFYILLVLLCVTVYVAVCFVCFCLVVQAISCCYVIHVYYSVKCSSVSLSIIVLSVLLLA